MAKGGDFKPYDLEERTYLYAKRVIKLTKNVPRSIANIEVMKQLVRAAGSVGANYIEANEAISRKDFRYRLHICRKESKESRYWLRLLDIQDERLDGERRGLMGEATELLKIFSAMIKKSG